MPNHTTVGPYNDYKQRDLSAEHCVAAPLAPASSDDDYGDSAGLAQLLRAKRLAREALARLERADVANGVRGPRFGFLPTQLPSLRAWFAHSERAPYLHNLDCRHWCLPGVPELWRALLYDALRQVRPITAWSD